MSKQDDDSDRSFEPTPQKLERARQKGDVARSADLGVAAAYTGLLLTLAAVGPDLIDGLGAGLASLIDRADRFAPLVFESAPETPLGGVLAGVMKQVAPWFVVPAAAVLAAMFAQRALVFAPDRIKPKLSRISLIANAKNKFGRSGLFEFFKSFAKLCLYSICLGLFARARSTEVLGVIQMGPRPAIMLMGRLLTEFLFLAVMIAAFLGVIDALWQFSEHRRRNRMTRKEIMDEAKESEGDPYIKQNRRARGQAIATKQMMADVPTADVVIVNPTHFAVALKWSRLPGSAPVCVAKGVGAVAATIREVAAEAGVPVHSDPPTARALHATVELGDEIAEEHYAPVAAAIRFAEAMRQRARGRVT